MKVFYIAGAYRGKTTHDTLTNMRKAEELAILVWKAGHVALCPHLNTYLMDGIVTDDQFLKGDIELLNRCDGMVLIPGWAGSKGTVQEIDFALSNNIPIITRNDIRQKI